MKANELMIGDWVMVDMTYPSMGKKKPCQVTLQDLICVEQGIDVEPIPLTAEILEKNGWKKSRVEDNYGGSPFDFYSTSAKDGRMDDMDCYAGVTVTKYDCSKQLILGVASRKVQITRHYVKYVHELQHALRLCGLNELADSLIV